MKQDGEIDKEKIRIRIESEKERKEIRLRGLHLSAVTNQWNEFSLNID